jgi:HAD superfamily hydrolase (TIGR01549 family)
MRHQPGTDSSAMPPGAVIFDLDGTLTRPYFDFDAIRREIGLATEPRTPVLEALERMTPDERGRAERILHEHEERAARECRLWEDAPHVLDAIRRRRVPVALLTRNSRRSAETVVARHALAFDCVHTREDGPVKPSPEPVLSICRTLGAAPSSSWVVGDYLFDIQSGRAAGAVTVLMVGDGPEPAYADQADHVIRRLTELLDLLGIG